MAEKNHPFGKPGRNAWRLAGYILFSGAVAAQIRLSRHPNQRGSRKERAGALLPCVFDGYMPCCHTCSYFSLFSLAATAQTSTNGSSINKKSLLKPVSKIAACKGRLQVVQAIAGRLASKQSVREAADSKSLFIPVFIRRVQKIPVKSNILYTCRSG